VGQEIDRAVNDRPPLNPRVFWPLAVVGILVMGFGIYGLIDNADETQPDQWIRWFLGSALAHDFVLAPVVAAVSVLVARRVPTRYRAIVQGALIASGIVALIAYPFVRGYGRRPGNPSALPNNYLIGLLVVVALVWVVASFLAWRVHRHDG
jgi:hypothetical protein